MKLQRLWHCRSVTSLARSVASIMLLAAQGSFAVSDPAQLIEASEQGMYAADFDRATTALNAALAGTAAGGDARLALLLQKLRVQQNARLAGVTLDDENATMVEITTLAQTTRSRDLIGQAALRLAVSRYFTNLLADDTDRVINFVPEFRAAAQMIDAPCRRTEALFFVGLMPQIVGLVASSKADLEAAQTYAKKCPLEQSYIDRHLAAVADDAGDLAAALELARRSSEERRRIGFKIFLPFSLLLEADLEERNGNRSRAQALLLEAAKLSAQLKLSASQRAACAAVAEHKLSSGHC